MASTTSLTPALPPRIHVLEVMGNAIVGGMETYVARLIERLPRERFNVTALCPFESRFTDQLRKLDVEVLIAPMPDDPPWSSIQTACALIRTGNVDVLHAHLPNAHLLAGLSGRLTGKPVLATIHGRQLTTLDLEVHRTVGSHLAVVCKQTYFHAVTMGVNAAQLSCIPNGVDTQLFLPHDGAAHRDGPLRKQFAVPTGVPLVGFIGRLSAEKGPELFLQAALLLHRRLPETHFVLVGDGPLRETLAAFIERFGLGNRVHLAGVRSEMAAVYKELDLVVSTSRSEAMPLALMEAMSCGLPVVATSVGGVPEMIEHGHTGWLVEPNDFEKISERVAELLKSPADMKRMGGRARQRAVERMGIEDSVTRVAQLFTRLVPARGEQRRMSAVARDPAA